MPQPGVQLRRRSKGPELVRDMLSQPLEPPSEPKGIVEATSEVINPHQQLQLVDIWLLCAFCFSGIQQLPLMYSSNPQYVLKLASFLDFNFDLCNYGGSFQGFNLPMMCSNNPPYGLKWISFLDSNFDLCNYG